MAYAIICPFINGEYTLSIETSYFKNRYLFTVHP